MTQYHAILTSLLAASSSPSTLHTILVSIGKWVEGVITGGGYPGIGLLMAIESACIPLPSELIMPFAGYAVSQGKFDIHMASIAGSVGCMIGSYVAYMAGKYGGRPFVHKYGKYLLIRSKDMDAADRFFDKHGLSAVFISRMLPIIRTFISFPAGVSRVPLVPFLFLSLAGSLPWCYLLTWAGVKLGQNWHTVGKYLHGVDYIVAAVIILSAAYWIWHHFAPEKPSAKAPNE